MTGFVGRTRELAALMRRVEHLERTGGGYALAIRGRRQVGKSRLVQEFCDRSGLPYLYFTAVNGDSEAEAVRGFSYALRESTLVEGPETVPLLDGGDWGRAFALLAGHLPDTPSVVVLDEVPWLAERSATFEGHLQVAWDRVLSRKPVLLLLLGSDVHMMERIGSYDRPFYGRADNMKLGPLNPAQTSDALGLNAAEAIDAHLISGGLPGILHKWPHGMPPAEFVRMACEDSGSPLFSVPDYSLMAEFSSPDQAKSAVQAVGSGDRTHANIAAKVGGGQGALPSGTLSPILRRLVEEKQMLAQEHPLSVKPGKPALYHVADSNMRLYLGILRAAQAQVLRGRPEAAYNLFERRWTSWRGRAVEPLVRDALETVGVVGGLPWEGVNAVGGWWNRSFQPEIDLVGADQAPVASELFFVGSIKWLGTPFDVRDLSTLLSGALHVPGYEPGRTGTVVVTLSGVSDTRAMGPVDLLWGPDDILAAYR